MAQFTRPAKVVSEEASASPGRSQRPRGVALSALALLAPLTGSLLGDLFELHRTAPGSGSSGVPPNLELLRIGSVLAIGVLSIWYFRQGRSWARLLVLLWSFATVARALSFLAEHNLDPAALMASPLRFFQTVLAATLLYWLNTPKVRAWYRKSSSGAGDLIADRLRGRLCTEVDSPSGEGTWHLYFEHDAQLILRCPWRIVLDDNLAFATAHDGDAPPAPQAARGAFAPLANQRPPETVPSPGHSPHEARRLLENLRVRTVRLAPRSSDLFVSFEMGIELQTWKPSGQAGPAPLWEYSDPALTVVAGESGVRAQLAVAPSETED